MANVEAVVFGLVEDAVVVGEVDHEQEGLPLAGLVDALEGLSGLVLISEAAHKGREEEVVFLVLHLFDELDLFI